MKVGNNFYTGEEYHINNATWNRIAKREIKKAEALISKCTDETYVDCIEDESEIGELNKKLNRRKMNGKNSKYMHYKLPSGLHIYAYVSTDSTDYMIFTSEVGEETKTVMKNEGINAYLPQESDDYPCLMLTKSTSGIDSIAYSNTINSDKIYSAVIEISGLNTRDKQQLITETKTRERGKTPNIKDYKPSNNDSQLLDNGFWDAIRKGIPTDEGEKLIDGFEKLKKLIEKERMLKEIESVSTDSTIEEINEAQVQIKHDINNLGEKQVPEHT